MPAVAHLGVPRALGVLLERGLVFHEGERYLSLLVPPRRPASIPLAGLAGSVPMAPLAAV